jgi:hypothetical protein
MGEEEDMTVTMEKPVEAVELEATQAHRYWEAVRTHQMVKKLRAEGAGFKEIGEALGLSESQASRIASGPWPVLPAQTSDDLVEMAGRGEIDHDELVEWLKVWPYEPDYIPKHIWDDPEWRPNTFDAVYAACDRGLLSSEDYKEIFNFTVGDE